VVLGALAPDVDAVLMPFGWDVYLWAHEIGTHSLVGSLGVAALTALVIRLFARDSRYPPLLMAAWVGSLSHLALDVLSGAHVRLGWPWLDGRLSVPLIAMADPAVMAIFAAGAILLIVVRKRPVQWQRLGAIVVLVAAFLFLAVKALLLARAVSSLRSRSEQASNRVLEARWASLTEWHVYDRTADALQQWQVRPGSDPVLLLSWPIGSEPPLVTKSRSLPTVRNFLRVHDLGFAVLLPDRTGATHVLWSDIRYCWASETPVTEPVVAAITPGAMRITCSLWFGGTFDDGGRVLRQRVQVGRWIQTRAP